MSSFFVNTLTFGESTAYRGLVAADVAGLGGFRMVGTFAGFGLLGAVDADGRSEWQKTYTIAGRTVRFWSGVRCDDGDLMIHGSLVVPPDRNEALILRVGPTGDVRWANTYSRDRTVSNIRLIKGIGDTYFFAGWSNESGQIDDVEVVRIDGTGKVLGAAIIHTAADDELTSITATKDGGCVLAGGTTVAGTSDCFVIVLDSALKVIWKRRIGDTEYQQAVDVVQTAQAGVGGLPQFVLTGQTGDLRKTFMATLTPNDVEITARIYDFRPGVPEHGTRRLLVSGNRIHLIANSQNPLTGIAACFDSKLTLLWQKSLTLPGFTYLSDIAAAVDGAGGVAVCGVIVGDGPLTRSLLAYTDAELASCVTRDLNKPAITTARFRVAEWEATVTDVKMNVAAQTVTVRAVAPSEAELCPTGVSLDLENARFQSPYIYLQAAGSDFSDQTVRGIDLRWDLLRSLGKAHLPKGNLAAPGSSWPTTIGYNRADDFVRIYKTELKEAYGVTVNFSQVPTTFVETGPAREWLYEDLVSSPGQTTDVSIRFADVAQYDALRSGVDPHTAPQNLFLAYTGLLEARAIGKLAFAATFVLQKLQNVPGQRLRVEAIGISDPLDNASRRVACRRTFNPSTTQPTPAAISCENIESVRFDFTGLVPVSLQIATYEDFLAATSAGRRWRKIGDFSLDDGNADADAAVFRRLENAPGTVIDGVWPKFRPAPAPAGVFRIKAQNYRDRWRTPNDGLKQAVTTYLDVSRTDVKANVTTPNADLVVNSSTAELSYLDLLNFVSLDFHVARMLGLGTIDPQPAIGPATRFVYLMQYVTVGRLEHETPGRVMHCYMTPPTGIADYRKPPAPAISLTYGLPPEACGGATTPLTDANGYALFDSARFVNLERAPFRYEAAMESFFRTPAEFCLCEETVPVAFGAKYGPGPAGSGNEVQPEISRNPDWLDPAGIAEVSPIPERGANPVYTHQERSAGIHHYWLYSINWFSRISDPSNEVQTDATKFAPRNTLLPPSNFAVQLIQKEDPRIFTSADEQQKLSQLPAGDKTLVRVTFDWNHIQNQAYQSADTVEIYFRKEPPETVRGEIDSVTEDATTHRATVTTKPYVIASTDPATTVQPEILDANRYTGARLSVGGQSWIVDSIPAIGPNPTLVLRQIRSTESISADHGHSFCTVETWSSPAPGDRFLIAENTDDPALWNTNPIKQVPLAAFTPLYTETIVHNDGQTRTLHVGGLTDAAVVQEVPDPDPGIGAFIPAGGPSSVPSGAYTVTFAGKQLPAIADPDVELHEGVIRMPGVDGSVKLLRVWKIGKNNAQQLELTVYDSELGWQRDDTTGMFLLDGNHQFIPAPGFVPVVTGNVASVNVHPSYRVYLKSSSGLFGEPSILPARGEGSRQTYMAARSRDSSLTPVLTSPMTRPAAILAIEMREPVAPGPPLGPLFATRPNFFGKATYTFDVQVDDPDSLIFFKANDRKILDQLYKPETVRSILAQLDAMSDFELGFNSQRWHDLVHVVTGPDDLFLEHTSNGFRFPIPDNPRYAIPDARPKPPPPVHPFDGVTKPGTMRAIVQDAIDGAFVPLTEVPLVYRQLTNTTMQTSGRPPKPDDRWPMAVRYQKANTRWVRFTDHTIDGASKNLYFYYAVELSDSQKISGRSGIAGPVQLVNAAPPEAPVIRKVTARLADGVEVTAPRVDFSLSGYLPSEGVARYRLYRALDADAALSVRTMTELKDFPADAAEIYDDFGDLGYVPFGQSIHYRAVAFRAIINEQSLPELVPSQPSNLATAYVADTVNPAPPPLEFVSDPLTADHPFRYENVRLEWPRTTYNGQYHLYKLNDVGMWIRIASAADAPLMQVNLQDTTLGTAVLLKEDAAGNTLYHRFRVTVENSSGLMNLAQKELTV